MPVSKRVEQQQQQQAQPAVPIKSDPSRPYWTSECGRAVVYVGDCREVMALMEPEQFYAVVTDPPYNLTSDNAAYKFKYTGSGNFSPGREARRKGFMNQNWDGTGVAFDLMTWEDTLRTVKPGAHLLSFGGTRTFHRMVCAMEDAGWDIRDTIMWVYGSGFPKSHDVSKAIDKMLGAKREKVKKEPRPETSGTFCGSMDTRPWIEESRKVGYHEVDGSEPITDAARQWKGWGTALKPAVEMICVARKLLSGTVARNVLEHDTGAMNIDGCRVGTEGGTRNVDGSEPNYLNNVYGVGMGGNPKDPNYRAGRWPVNLIHDGSEEVLELFPESRSASAVTASPLTPGDSIGGVHGDKDKSTLRGFDDSGNAARFFYTAKADNDDRPHGKGATSHPTVKPLDLMQYLVRLVCVPGGVVLDPFMGSGSTGCAAILEGMRFVGIEQSREYADIAVGRLKLALIDRPTAYPTQVSGKANMGTTAPLPPRRLRDV